MEIEERLFANEFEVRALSDVSLYGKAERWVHGFCLKSTEDEHLERYKYASSLVKNKTVLDIASGCGYGTRYLYDIGSAKRVMGVDLSSDSIRYAAFKYATENVEFICANATEITLDNKFDVIVSFETIEHLDDVQGYLKRVYEQLDDNGMFVVSTPICRRTNNSPTNPYHKIEWCYDDFIKLISPRFIVDETFLQSHVVLNKNYGFFHTLAWRISRIFRIKLNNIPKRHVSYGVGLKKAESDFDFSVVETGYMVFKLFKR
jgi:SAM-dependent methyltransferase